MSRSIDYNYEEPPAASPAFKAGVAIGGLILLALLIWGIRAMMNAPVVPRHQTAKIMLLPDQPPPPPPKEEKKPEPKPEAKPQPQPENQKTPPPPEPQQLKMEGAAGDAPSPFSAGEVKNDYKGGEIGGGDDRYKYAAYTSRLTQQIQDELSRRKLRDSGGKVLLWLSPGGEVARFKLLRTFGNPATEQLLQTAFAELVRVREAPPADMPMPIGLDISVQ
jgi:protein TonB